MTGYEYVSGDIIQNRNVNGDWRSDTASLTWGWLGQESN